MDQEIFTAWFLPLVPALWAGLLCGITLMVGTRLVSRLIVSLLLLLSWIVHTPVCGYIVAYTGAAILGSYGSIGIRIALGTITSGLVLVWLAHLGALVTIWQPNAEHMKIRWALVFPAGWLLIGLGWVRW